MTSHSGYLDRQRGNWTPRVRILSSPGSYSVVALVDTSTGKELWINCISETVAGRSETEVPSAAAK